MKIIIFGLLASISFVASLNYAWAEGEPTGASCTKPSDCDSGYCYPGPANSGWFCLHKSRNCAWRGGHGVMYGVHKYNGNCYTCTSEGGRIAHWKKGGGSFLPWKGVFNSGC